MIPFDPFNDRPARDIRNGLSTQFIDSLEKSRLENVQDKAKQLLSDNCAEHYRVYIKERLIRYEKVFHIISDDGIKDPVQQALVLWDQGLFFEVHKLLEKEWLRVKGNRKKAVQGFIRAAGMYVHLEQGNLVGAEKMADKATEALQQYGELLSMKRLDTLLESLNHLNQVPPRLYFRNIK